MKSLAGYLDQKKQLNAYLIMENIRLYLDMPTLSGYIKKKCLYIIQPDSIVRQQLFLRKNNIINDLKLKNIIINDIIFTHST